VLPANSLAFVRGGNGFAHGQQARNGRAPPDYLLQLTALRAATELGRLSAKSPGFQDLRGHRNFSSFEGE